MPSLPPPPPINIDAPAITLAHAEPLTGLAKFINKHGWRVRTVQGIRNEIKDRVWQTEVTRLPQDGFIGVKCKFPRTLSMKVGVICTVGYFTSDTSPMMTYPVQIQGWAEDGSYRYYTRGFPVLGQTMATPAGNVPYPY